ncbi:MAG: putative bifunctional diguanylate cyclase/phosphodiesterase [Chloroflexota bacterium]
MREAVRSRSILPFYLAAAVAAILLGIDLAVSLLVTDPQQKTVYSDFISPAFDLLATLVLFLAAKESIAYSRRFAVAWGMIALATLTYAMGDINWGILELVLKEQPVVSIADTFYLAYYLFMLIGVFLLPNKPSTPGEQVANILDIVIVMASAVLGFWNFLLGPVASSNADLPVLQQVILIAYPVGDLVLLWALLRIIYSPLDQHHEAPAFLLATGISVAILADSVYIHQSLMGTYVSGSFLDIEWRASILLIGLAGVSQITAIRSLESGRKPSRWFEFLVSGSKRIAPYFSYFWLIGAYLLLIQSYLVPLTMNFLALSIGVGVIICLVLLRQIIMLFENKKLNTDLQQAMERLQIQAAELETTNQELQNEIAERKVIEQELTYDSLHDAMTGLPNRVLFLDRLGQAIKYSKRRTDYTCAVLFIDIDLFKVINDSLGHLAGDQLLISMGRRMRATLRSSDTIARLGGDEFAVLLEITGTKESALVVAAKVQEAIKLPFKVDGHELHITASIGVVMNMEGYDLPEEILRDADIAMYQAKASGKARFEVFDIRMRSQAFSRLETEQELRLALENREFQIYYQPILSLRSNQLVSFEALIRWCHPKRGLILPGEFLPVAEASGLILSIENWVLNEACMQLKKWHTKYPGYRHVNINVNISSRQFSQPNFVNEVVEALQRNDLRPESLRLEITENVLISNYTAANKVFAQLRDLGIQLQIDDFGSGYSSLGYLQHFPISGVKIDKSFIDGMGKGRKGTELIRAIVSMTRELDMEATAEGIETDEQLNALKDLLCSLGQGFLLSRPLDKESAEKMFVPQ